MAIRKIEIRPPGSGDYGDVLYPKTSADIVTAVLHNEPITVQEYLEEVEGAVYLLAGEIDRIDQGLGTAAGKDTGTASGQVPVLGSGGKLDSSILPALAITETHVVANQAAMLALTVQIGDVAVRTDLNKTFILKAEPAATLANWQELLTPTDAVTSVAGKTGVVTLTGSDVGLGSVQNYGLATKAEAEAGSSNAKYMTPLQTKEAIDALQAVKSVAGKTGEVTLAKGDVGLGSVDNTSDANKPVSVAQQAALDLKAPIASPALTGTPTAPTAAAATNTTQIATTAFVKAQNYLTGITKAQIEEQLTGTIASHSHAASAPAAHATTHVTGGGDVIPNVVAAGNSGLMSGADKAKLDGIATGANKYTHPTGDGNLHVPATGTITGAFPKFLKANSGPGVMNWGHLGVQEIENFPSKLSQFTNDKNFISSFLTIGTVQPTNGDLWFKELS